MKSSNRRGIYLVGFSGSGKSTIAQAVGRRLYWPVCDLDDLIVERAGMTIPEIFQHEGEAGFRLREAEALRVAASESPFVIATGGGAVVQQANLAFMSSTGWMICLEAQPETLLARIQQQSKDSDQRAARPMLDAADQLNHIRQLKSARQSGYDRADWVVQTDQLTPEQVVDEVLRAVDTLEKSAGH